MRAIVHSGGGVKGAYGTGVISYLMGELKTDYQIFCGNSVGAINMSFLSQFKKGQEIEAATKLKELWLTLDNHKIYRPWFPLGRLYSIWKSSFFDSTPLQDLVKENIKLDRIRQSGKQVVVGSVAINSGKYFEFDQNDNDFIEGVLSSAAFPIMLRPIKLRDQIFIDGGCKELSPIRMAIEQGADHIDIITSAPEIRIKKFIEKPSIIDIVKRVIDISTDTILENDIERALMYNKLAIAGLTDKKPIELRIFRPHNSLSEDALNFDPEKITEMIETGYEDAKRMCEIDNIE